ncbi:protein LEAD-SENSITIVE 1-like [Curcuma longa]|uniref:protein LEAD-SENSITIVE 1-like n=1 Tax=Curcuma longa TaxID=136217 RepID=UPI003D9E8DBC
MGLLSNKVERAEIKAGDHIYTWRAVYTYAHHGIYVGGNKVVHFTRKKDTSGAIDSFDSSSISSSSSSGVPEACPTFPDCGFHQPSSGVVLTCLDCFLGNGSLYSFEYGVPTSVFLAKVRGGTCTIAESDPPDTVINRAMHLLQNGFGNYDVFDNNCEDFALYCKTGLLSLEELGIGRSGQASSLFGVPLSALLSMPFKLLAAGPVGMATVTAGMYCANRYITDIGVRKDVVKVSMEDLASNISVQHSRGTITERPSDATTNVASIEEEKR